MRVVADADLRPLNSFRVAARARWLVSLERPEEVARLLEDARFAGLPRLILGGGSNVLFVGDYPGVILQPAFGGCEWQRRDDGFRLRVGAGESWHATVRHSVEAGRGGLENLSLIPGRAGAAPVQNIGAYGVELRERLAVLEAVDMETGLSRRFDRDDCRFSYRHSRFKEQAGRWLITSVTLHLPRDWHPRLDYPGIATALGDEAPTPRAISDAICTIRRHKLPDPERLGNAGSFFKNPVVTKAACQRLLAHEPELPAYPQADGGMKLSAAWLIERCGWRGHRDGDAGVSGRHALVLVNHGRATGAQILTLARRIRDAVEARFGVRLEAEPLVVGGKL